MTVDFVTLQDFESTFHVLLKTHNDMSRTYDSLIEILQVSKDNKVPFIGNPLIKSQNHLIELSYLLRQHKLNCTVYQELIFDNVELDHLFVQQLRSLMEMTTEIITKYGLLKEKLIDIPMYANRKQAVV